MNPGRLVASEVQVIYPQSLPTVTIKADGKLTSQSKYSCQGKFVSSDRSCLRDGVLVYIQLGGRPLFEILSILAFLFIGSQEFVK